MAERGRAVSRPGNPWPALWALSMGFFMILVDATIVSVATPAIMADLGADVASVVWVTSAYLLAYAVPLLVTGRLGDRFGPKRVYSVGLVIFTLASLWCGLTADVEQLILARIVQGLGASLMNPQTMAVITRTFPADQRGRAMSLWGAVAGVATLVGPILGGVLVDTLGWEWIFFVNVPVGVVALVLAQRLVPDLPTHVHRFDLLGMALSGVGMLLLVFGIQEGQSFDWGTIAGPVSVWSLIVAGLVVLAGFVLWQLRGRHEPLLSMALFRDRNFSLANVAITTVGFTATSMSFPLMLYAQGVRGLSPTEAALLLAPMAVLSGLLAPVVGRLTDRHHPRYVAGVGMLCFPVGLAWLAAVLVPGAAIWELLLPLILIGAASAFVWAPIASTATRNLPMAHAGAGAGVYNTTRQVGAVLGSAGIAAMMEARDAEAAVTHLPPAQHGAFAAAMSQSLLLPAGVLLAGLVAVLCFARPLHLRRQPSGAALAPTPLQPDATSDRRRE
jgi:EmrB/QacA subfamily drug resistance transporter